jgi:hypothetical protein
MRNTSVQSIIGQGILSRCLTGEQAVLSLMAITAMLISFTLNRKTL